MNSRDNKLSSKGKNLDLYHYEKPTKSKKIPSLITFENPTLHNLDNYEWSHRTEENEKKERRIISTIPECFRLEFDIEPEEVMEMDPRNIRNKRDPEMKNQFTYNFYNTENFENKEIDLVRSYLDNYNHQKYKVFKNMLEGKSCAKPVGNLFITGNIDLEKQVKKIRDDEAKLVENINTTSNNKRMFIKTNDSISNTLGRRNFMTNDFRQYNNINEEEKTPSNKIKNKLKQPFRDFGNSKNEKKIKDKYNFMKTDKESSPKKLGSEKPDKPNVIIPQSVKLQRTIPINRSTNSKNKSEPESDKKGYNTTQSINMTQSNQKENNQNDTDTKNHFSQKHNNDPSISSKPLESQKQTTGFSQFAKYFDDFKIISQINNENVPASYPKTNLSEIHSQSSVNNKNQDSINLSMNDSVVNPNNISCRKNDSVCLPESASSKKSERNMDNNSESVSSSQKAMCKNYQIKYVSVSKDGKISMSNKKEIYEGEVVNSNKGDTLVSTKKNMKALYDVSTSNIDMNYELLKKDKILTNQILHNPQIVSNPNIQVESVKKTLEQKVPINIEKKESSAINQKENNENTKKESDISIIGKLSTVKENVSIIKEKDNLVNEKNADFILFKENIDLSKLESKHNLQNKNNNADFVANSSTLSEKSNNPFIMKNENSLARNTVSKLSNSLILNTPATTINQLPIDTNKNMNININKDKENISIKRNNLPLHIAENNIQPNNSSAVIFNDSSINSDLSRKEIKNKEIVPFTRSENITSNINESNNIIPNNTISNNCHTSSSIPVNQIAAIPPQQTSSSIISKFVLNINPPIVSQSSHPPPSINTNGKINTSDNSTSKLLNNNNPFLKNTSNLTSNINNPFLKNNPINPITQSTNIKITNNIQQVNNIPPTNDFQNKNHSVKNVNLVPTNNNFSESKNCIQPTNNLVDLKPTIHPANIHQLKSFNPFVDTLNQTEIQADPYNISMEIDQSKKINILRLGHCSSNPNVYQNNNINSFIHANNLSINNSIPNTSYLNSDHNVFNKQPYNNQSSNYINSNVNVIASTFNNFVNNTSSIPKMVTNPFVQPNTINNMGVFNSSIPNQPEINNFNQFTKNNNVQQLNSNPFAVSNGISNNLPASNSVNRFNINSQNNQPENRFNNTNTFTNYNVNNNSTGNIFLQAAFNPNHQQQKNNQTSSLLDERPPEGRRYVKVVSKT